MALKRENVGDHNVLYIRSNADDELDALEQLGPAMRQALRYAPIKSSALSILRDFQIKNEQIAQKNIERRAAGVPELRLLDPQDPMLDLHVANGFLQLQVQALRKDRSEVDAIAGVTPLRAKRVRQGNRRYR